MANKMRDAAKDQFWRGMLNRFAASGLSVRAFCRNQKLAESAFYAWRRTICQRDAEVKCLAKATRKSARPAKPPVFLPLLVTGNGQSQGSITLELAGGRVLRFPEAIAAERLSEIVAALETRAGQ